MGEIVLTCSCNLTCISLSILGIFKNSVFIYSLRTAYNIFWSYAFPTPNFSQTSLYLASHPTSYPFLFKQGLVCADWLFLIMVPSLQYGWYTQYSCDSTKELWFSFSQQLQVVNGFLSRGVTLCPCPFLYVGIFLAWVCAEKLKAFSQNQGQVKGIHS